MGILCDFQRKSVKGEEEKCKAFEILLEKIQMLNLLSEPKQHSLFKNACNNLLRAHLEFNNFYNEPPFAERLMDLTRSIKTPESVQYEFVYTVLMGYVGNFYGISNAAIPYYEDMIKNFSPKEINHMIHLLDDKSLFYDKINNRTICKQRYILALKLIDRDSMNSRQLIEYDRLISKLEGY